MVHREHLLEILKRPLGPYHDKGVLDESCQSTGHYQLFLDSFILEHNGQVIGLDESERPLDREGDDSRKFRFRGILKIVNPNWLSDFGVKIVEAELNTRLAELCMGNRQRVRSPALTLEDLYRGQFLRVRNSSCNDREEDGPHLSLLIQGERGLPGVFMGSSKAPHGLLWNSKDHNRQYEVLSMDVATYSRSENFFWRYRLLALMKKIVSDPSTLAPIGGRDPEWFVKKYMVGFAYPQGDTYRRLIYDSNDPDLDENGHPRTPRQLLHVHKSEILSLFAAHAEWLVTNELPRNRSILDIKVWDTFCRTARKERKEAARNGIRWGWPVGQELRADDSCEDDDDVVMRNPVIGKSDDILQRKLEKARKKPSVMGGLEESSSDSASEEGEHDYAHEFLDESDFEWDPEEVKTVDPGILDAIPWQLQTPPDPPDADGRWQCPVQDCQYQIDLRNVTPEMGQGVDGEAIRYIIRKHWTNVYMDKGVLRGWRQMVHKHYDDHLAEVGVRFVNHGRQERIEWAQPRPSPESDHVRGNLPPKGSLRGELSAAVVHVTGDAD